MQKKQFVKILFLALVVLILSAACRRAEETPTPPPTTPAETPDETGATEPTTEPAADPTATAEPEVSEPDLSLIAAVDPSSIDWAPQVVYSSPLPGDEVMLDGAITIRFDQPMDQESVEEAFEVVPAGILTETESIDTEPVEGEFQWPQADTLIFTPATSLERQQRYQVRIGTEATSRNGQPLLQDVELAFQTAGNLEVAQVSPADGVTNVSPLTVITVFFNRPVVPLVTTGQQADLPDPLQIDPPVEGTGEWTATSIYRFQPAEGFAGGAEYTVTIPADLEDVTGNTLAEDVTWSFTVARPSVSQILPESASQGIAPTTAITITFNTPMDPASTEAAISLDPAVPLSFEWDEDGRTVVAQPEEMLALNTRYTVTVAGSAQGVTGDATLDRETQSTFTTVPLPTVRSTSPTDGSLAEVYQYGVNIEFAGPMDPETILDRIQIDPAPRRLNYSMSDNGQYVFLDFDLERNAEYTVTIPGDVADPYGNTLGEDYVFTFSTAGLAALASVNLPGPIAQLSTDHPSEVLIIHRNISNLEATLYDVGLPLALMNETWRLPDFRPDTGALRTWELNPQAGQNEAATLPLDLGEGQPLPTGVYLLAVRSSDLDQNNVYWQNQRVLLVVADTNIVVKEMPDEVHVWVTDLATGAPAADRDVTLYSRAGESLGTAVTDEDGFARFNYQPPENYLDGVIVTTGEPGAAGFGVASSIWSTGVSPWQFNVNSHTGRELPEFAYLYTDRPIYRPGDTVYFKGILREANYGRYDLPGRARSEVAVRAEYFSFFDGTQEVLFEQSVSVDEFGTFSGEIALPEGTALGTYRIYLTGETEFQVQNAGVDFQVAEYRRPEFQVTVTPEQEEALRGETVAVTVEARYFFGAPAADLRVAWTLYQQPFVPQWEGPYYQFTNDDSFNYYFDPFSSRGPGYFGEYVTAGSGQTDSQGRLTVNVPADLLDEVQEGSRLITMEAQVVDLSEFPVAAHGSFVLHAADTYVGIRPADTLSIAGSEAAVELVTVDWDGEPVAGEDVEVVFYERTYEYIRELRFGMYMSIFEPIDTEVARTTVTTDADGEAVATFVPEFGGTYRAVATVTDAGGRTHSSNTFLWAGDENFIGWRTDPRERRMDLTPDQPEYEVGDTAEILVQSPFAGPAYAWVTIERGNLIDQELVVLETNSDIVEIPITPDMAPNAYVTIVTVKGLDDTNEFADIRMGVVELRVSPERLLLNLELTPQEDVLRPGETVAYDIRATDYAGNGVQTNLSLALVDLAVLTLVPDNQQPIGDAFYQRLPYTSQTGSGLFISGEGLEVELPTEPGGFGGGGGDGGALDVAALDDEDDARRNFPDTAFWEASLITDEDGTATIDIPLPDSTTTWRLSAKGVTEDTLVGQASVDIVATLPMLIRPVTPRFFTVGDLVQVGAIVNNNTNESLDVTVSLEATGLTLEGEAEQQVTVAAGSQELVRWPVTVEDVVAADLTFRAEGGEYSDATKPTFGFGPDQLVPVYRYDAEDIVGSSGVLTEAERRFEAVLLPDNVDPRRGELDIRLQPSLAAAIFEAIDVIEPAEIESACAHEVVHGLLPNVAASMAFREADIDVATVDENLDAYIESAIRRLAALQISGSGGWGYCESDEVHEYLTAYILFGLAKAEEAGYDTSPVNVDFALRSLTITSPQRISSRFTANRQAFFLYVLAAWDRADVEDLDALFEEHQDLLDPYAQAYLVLAYEMAGEGDAEAVEALLADLNSSAIVSATGAHWEDELFDWNNLSSTIRGTAVVIDALAKLDPENPLAAQAVRWLMSSREAQIWPTHFETVWSLLALTDWVAATGELEADYNYAVGVNMVTLDSGLFDDSNLTEAVEVSVPLQRLPEEDISYIEIAREAGPGRLYYTTHLDAYLMASTVEAVSRGVQVERVYYDAACDPEQETCEPITEITAGQPVRVQLTIIAANDVPYLVVEDPIPAGTEAQNPGLAITASTSRAGAQRGDDVPYGYWGWWFFNDIQFHDEKVVFRSSYLPAGSYQYTYVLQPTIPGEYQVMPAIAYQEFFPEVFGRSNGMLFVIAE